MPGKSGLRAAMIRRMPGKYCQAFAGSFRYQGHSDMRAYPPRRAYRQVSLTVRVLPVPVLRVRLEEPSQVTLPSGFFLMYLYWMAVFLGSHTVLDQTG